MIPPQLVQALEKAAAQLRDSSSFHLVSHFDADGLAVCAIISTALDRQGIEHTTRALPNLGQEQLDSLDEEGTLGLSRNSDGTTKISLRVAGFNSKDINGLLTQMIC